MSRKEKKAREQKLSTRQLINMKAVSDYSLKIYDGGELVYFMIRPTTCRYCLIPEWGPGCTP